MSSVRILFTLIGWVFASTLLGCSGKSDPHHGQATEATSTTESASQQLPVEPLNEDGVPPKVAAAKRDPLCTEDSVTDVSEDDRVLVLSNSLRYLISDENQSMTSSWQGNTVYYCNGGADHRYFVNEDGDSTPVGALDE